MFRRVLVVFLGILYATMANAQHAHNCATHTYFEEWVAQHPEALQRYKDMEMQLAPYFNTITPTIDRKTRAVVFKIPTVVHVIHKYGPEAISDNQVFDAIRILNNDFNKRNADTAAAVPAFANSIGRVEIEFVLARKDPQGVCTNGIDRIFSFKTDYGEDDAKLNGWDRTKYYNIWVVNKFNKVGVAGYSYFPSMIGGFGGINPMYDGVIILHDYMGSIGTGNAGTSRALTHETGHWLELPHPWGLNNDPGVACGDDGINDTPVTKGFTTCALTAATNCNVGIVENVQNFMDYSYCSMMFTPGQVAKMRSIVSNNVVQRGDLASTTNASFTGINNPPADCPIKADFGSSRYFGCINTSNFTIRNKSFGDTVSTSTWTLADGVYTQNGNSDFNVTFPSAGWKNASLTATSNAGTSTKTRNNLIYVSDPNIKRGFGYFQTWDHQVWNDEWPLFNIYENEVKWSIVGGGVFGGNCLKLSTFDKRGVPEFRYVNTYSGDIDEVISPAFDFTGQSAVKLGFFTSGARDINSLQLPDDVFTIFYSKNCGNTWTQLATYDAASLLNAGVKALEYAPAGDGDWVSRTVNLPSATLTGTVYFKFQYKASAAGNNFYLDNITFSDWATSITPDMAGTNTLIISPTANTGDFRIQTSVQDAIINITDLGGKVVYTTTNAALQAQGGYINLRGIIAPGMYMVNATRNGVNAATQKMIVQ
ncbi:MAG: hypothetical protein RL660_204 [Bacteroidota bacterium]|jgi:hypothetical protein